MRKVQHINIREGNQPPAAVQPPGNPRLWKVLQSAFGQLRCYRCQSLTVEWGDEAGAGSGLPALGADDWSRALGFAGLYSYETLEKLARPAIQVRRIGADADPLAFLVREWLERRGARIERVWVARHYEFVESADAQHNALLTQTLEKIVSLGPRSGVFHPAAEEARVVRPNESMAWPFAGESLRDGKSLAESIGDSLVNGGGVAMRQNYRLTERKAWSKDPAPEIHRGVVGKLVAKPRERSVLGAEAMAPVSFVLSAARGQEHAAAWAGFRHRCEVAAAQLDRSVGPVTLRNATSMAPVFEIWSPLPVNLKPLEVGAADATLYLVGPWDSRNAVVERRIEAWARIGQDANPGPTGGALVDGEQDWVRFFAQSVAHQKGWRVDPRGVPHLVRGNACRARYHRAWFYWGRGHDAERLQLVAAELGVPLHRLGKAEDSQKFRLGDGSADLHFELGMSELGVAVATAAESATPPIEASWTYPEEKSPTYGFERVMQFPHEYLERIVKKDARSAGWNAQAKLLSAGDRFRSVTMRDADCSALDAIRWTDGRSLWGDAVASFENWMDVDPRAAGAATLDLAVRHLVALGADVSAGGTAELWLSQPAGTGAPELVREAWGAYFLALEGACTASLAHKFSLQSINGAGVSYAGGRNEMLARLRVPMTREPPSVAPGFRMSGEALYMVGPRPAFVDAGSHILSSVTRVISNHISKLVPEVQMELYAHLHQLMNAGMVSCIRSVGAGGVARALAEMGLWGKTGVLLRPSLTVMDLFSGAPGRFVVGILPQDTKKFESGMKAELFTPLGSTGGEKILSLPLSALAAARGGGE